MSLCFDSQVSCPFKLFPTFNNINYDKINMNDRIMNRWQHLAAGQWRNYSARLFSQTNLIDLTDLMMMTPIWQEWRHSLRESANAFTTRSTNTSVALLTRLARVDSTLANCLLFTVYRLLFIIDCLLSLKMSYENSKILVYKTRVFVYSYILFPLSSCLLQTPVQAGKSVKLSTCPPSWRVHRVSCTS